MGGNQDRNVRERCFTGYGLVPHDPNVNLPQRFVEVSVDDMLGQNPERKGI